MNAPWDLLRAQAVRCGGHQRAGSIDLRCLGKLCEPERKPSVKDFFHQLRGHFEGHRARGKTRIAAWRCWSAREDTGDGGVVHKCSPSPSSAPWPQGPLAVPPPSKSLSQRIWSLHLQQGVHDEAAYN